MPKKTFQPETFTFMEIIFSNKEIIWTRFPF